MTAERALYVYAIAPATERRSWGPIGLDGAAVHSFVEGDLAALVHDAPGQPYVGDDARVKDWLLEHARVVEAAWREAGTVLPVGFNVLVGGEADRPPEVHLRGWLRGAHDELVERLPRFRDRVELTVELSVDPAAASEGGAAAAARAGLARKPPGLRRLLEKKAEQAEREAAERLADRLYPEVRRRLGALSEEVAERRRFAPEDGAIPLLAAALLVHKERVTALGGELAALGAAEPALRIRFLGPWPPYNFAGAAAGDGGPGPVATRPTPEGAGP